MCNHMRETDFVESFHFLRKHRIHGNLSHDFAPEGKIRWFIYLIEDTPCHKQYVGSTQKPTQRWGTHKSTCNSMKSTSTGLSKHFMVGCPNDAGKEKETLNFTLIDYHDTTPEILTQVNHLPGPKCQCSECNILKKTWKTAGFLEWELFMEIRV